MYRIKFRQADGNWKSHMTSKNITEIEAELKEMFNNKIEAVVELFGGGESEIVGRVDCDLTQVNKEQWRWYLDINNIVNKKLILIQINHLIQIR